MIYESLYNLLWNFNHMYVCVYVCVSLHFVIQFAVYIVNNRGPHGRIMCHPLKVTTIIIINGSYQIIWEVIWLDKKCLDKFVSDFEKLFS